MDFTPEPYDADQASQWLICVTCGTQFPTPDRDAVKTCFICDDPRQYVPASGQAFTALAEERDGRRNEITVYPGDDRVQFINTVPKLGIGQRAILIRTPAGNVLWDCVAFLDDETVRGVEELGGIQAMVISHPHFYTTHVQWARAFRCPVYVSAEDERWTTTPSAHRRVLTNVETEVLPGSGALAIKLGGHFPGSLVLLFDGRLLVADTLLTTPAGVGGRRTQGMNTFAFMWSVPNYIPLSGEVVKQMWAILSGYDFTATHGLMMGMDIEDDKVKKRVEESVKIHLGAITWNLKETMT